MTQTTPPEEFGDFNLTIILNDDPTAPDGNTLLGLEKMCRVARAHGFNDGSPVRIDKILGRIELVTHPTIGETTA